MRDNRFYINQQLQTGDSIALERTVAVHITKVLRMQTGDLIILFNGDGYDYLADLTVDNKKAQATITEQRANNAQSSLTTHLGQGLCRGDRMDYSIQKAVEMGVTEITPVVTERVQFRMDSKRSEKKMRHWHGVIIAACEQCGRADIPKLRPITALDEWLDPDGDELIVLDPEATQGIGDLLSAEKAIDSGSFRILVGPEGGLSSEEIMAATRVGHGVTLGPRVLRTETAGTAILAILQQQCGDI